MGILCGRALRALGASAPILGASVGPARYCPCPGVGSNAFETHSVVADFLMLSTVGQRNSVVFLFPFKGALVERENPQRDLAGLGFPCGSNARIPLGLVLIEPQHAPQALLQDLFVFTDFLKTILARKSSFVLFNFPKNSEQTFKNCYLIR